jgi:hypothetical protein
MKLSVRRWRAKEFRQREKYTALREVRQYIGRFRLRR